MFRINAFRAVGEEAMKNRRTWGFIVAAVAVVMAGWGAGLVFAKAGAEPGSAEDPLVTKSYVDALFASLGGQPPEDITIPGGSLAIETPVLRKGQKLIGVNGTEIIVRSGNAVAVGGKSGLGLPDVTAGVDIKPGKKVAPNHQIILPRDDGRGVQAVSQEVIVMVRGTYRIE